MTKKTKQEINEILYFLMDQTLEGTTYNEVAYSMYNFYKENGFLTVPQLKYLEIIVDKIISQNKTIEKLKHNVVSIRDAKNLNDGKRRKQQPKNIQ